MTRKQGDQKRADREALQETSTAPRPVDAQGRELDQWGLPNNGPARVQMLAELGKPDPNLMPDAWTQEFAPAVTTETENG